MSANTMSQHEFETMRKVEDSFWWYQVLRQAVASELKDRQKLPDGSRILDAGCGTGGMMDALRKTNPLWKLTGLDISEDALKHTRGRGFEHLHQGSLDALPFPEGSFDAVVSLDVMSNVGVNVTEAVLQLRRVLRPGGILVLNLPAYEALRGEHDAAVKTGRRFEPEQLKRLLEASGLRVFRLHCWNAWLFPPILAWRRLSRFVGAGKGEEKMKSDLHSTPPTFLNKLLGTVGQLDMALCRTVGSPVGTSVLAVAVRPEIASTSPHHS